jgi:hypothetical protein
MTIKVADLVARYQAIYEERMRDLPIVNPKLAVEAVGFDQWEEKDLGILITRFTRTKNWVPISRQSCFARSRIFRIRMSHVRLRKRHWRRFSPNRPQRKPET